MVQGHSLFGSNTSVIYGDNMLCSITFATNAFNRYQQLPDYYGNIRSHYFVNCITVLFSKEFQPAMSPNKTRNFNAVAAAIGGITLFAMNAGAQQVSPALPPTKPLPVSTGVVPLPQEAPSTTPLPVPTTPAVPAAPSYKPLAASPRLQAINGYLNGKPVSLREAIGIGLALSPDMARAVANLLIAQGNTSAARAALNPVANVNSQITEFDAATNASLGTAHLTLVNQFNPVVTAEANLPIDVTGLLRSAVSQAQFQQAAARIGVNEVRSAIVFNVQNAFYSVLRAQAQMAVAADTLKSDLRQLDDAQKNYAAGTSPRFDVLTAQTNVAVAQDSFLQAQRGVSLALLGLKQAMGIDVDSPLSISDRNAVPALPDADSVAPPATLMLGTPSLEPQKYTGPTPAEQLSKTLPAASTVEMPGSTSSPTVVHDPIDLGSAIVSLIKEALVHRPDILAADAQVDAGKKGIYLAKASMLPQLSLGMAYTLNPNAAGFTRYNQFAATLNITVPLWDGGLAHARLNEAQGAEAEAVVQRRATVDTAKVQVRQSYLAVLQARDRVAVATTALQQAQEAYRLAQVRYRAGVSQQPGVSPILELSNSQASLTQAQSNRVSALYDYYTARASLDQAIGRNAFVGVGPGYSNVPSQRQLPR